MKIANGLGFTIPLLNLILELVELFGELCPPQMVEMHVGLGIDSHKIVQIGLVYFQVVSLHLLLFFDLVLKLFFVVEVALIAFEVADAVFEFLSSPSHLLGLNIHED